MNNNQALFKHFAQNWSTNQAHFLRYFSSFMTEKANEQYSGAVQAFC
jgi:hypothetical protein